jgi:uncharacterized protein YjeT (DUF2065 family)
MSGVNQPRLSDLARTILALTIVLIVAGVMLHGISAGVWHRFFHDLIERTDAPMRFRFILQPTMAAIAAIRDARRDAVAGPRSVYLDGGEQTRGPDAAAT